MSAVAINAIIVGDRHRRDMGDLQALANSIAEVGLLQPIGLSPTNTLVFGERRLRACRDVLGWTEIPARVVDVPSIVRGEHAENEIRKDFTPSERVAILDAIKTRPLGANQHAAGSQNFATLDEAAQRSGFGNRETARQARTVVANGIPALVEAMDAGETSISAAAKVAALPVEQQEDIVRRSHFRTSFTGKTEWYTPVEYIELARQVLGNIDLDPASCEYAQSRVRARRYYTAEDDGLAKEWAGRVWLNPPYSQPAIVHFVEKLVASVQSGGISDAILLTNNYTDTSWFHHAESACAAICFTRGRIRFEDETSVVSAPVNGQSFFYYGQRVDLFREVFGTIGFVR
jgi:ParB family chromosome partitioning protein